MQSKAMSAIEQVCNVASGFIVSLLLWEFVICPYFDIVRTETQGIKITAIFTVASLIRGYLWRRVFNSGR